MRLSLLLTSAFTFGLATASVVPRAPQIPGVPPQCESSCSGFNDHLTKIIAGGDAATGAIVATCSDNILQSVKSCVECGYNNLPTTEVSQEDVRKLQDTINNFAAECNKLGLSVQPIAFNTAAAPTAPTAAPTAPTATPTATGKTGAALLRYEGGARVAGAVGVAVVAGFLAL